MKMNKSLKTGSEQLSLDLETGRARPELAPPKGNPVVSFVDAATLRVRTLAVMRVKKAGIFSLKDTSSFD